MKDTNDFGTRLEKLCKEKGITPSELARRISLSRKSIFEWVGKSGRIPRDPLHLKKLCEFFGVSPAWLLWGEEEKVSLEKLILAMRFSIIPEIKRFCKTIERWKDEVLNYFLNPITNAVTEGYNRIASLVKNRFFPIHGGKHSIIK